MNLSLKETPQSVSVITSKRMEDQQLNNLNDVLRKIPGVTVDSQASNTGFAQIYSRGYEIKNIQIDGAMSSSNNAYYKGNESMDSTIYDSVSVVRGATGLLTGAGDPSGSINLVRKKPTKDFQASIEAQTGRWDKYRGVVDIAGGFNEDGSIRGRFIAVHDQGGYFNPLLDKQNSTLYGVIEADLGDSTTISGTWERAEAENNGTYYGTEASIFFMDSGWGKVGLSNFDRYTWTAADWTKVETTKDTYTLSLNHHINDSWKIDTTYHYKEYENKSKYGICRLWTNYCNEYYEDISKNQKDKDKAHSLDVKLNGTFELFGQTHDLVAGFNGQKIKNNAITLKKSDVSLQDIKIINNKIVVPEPTWGGISRANNTETQQYGVFISTKLNFTDDLSAILGGRYSEWKTEKINNINNKVTDDRKFDNFLPYLALTYDLTENITTYASYTEIFNPQNYKDKDDKFLDPETGFNYEVGLKGEWFDGRLNSSIALFQSGKDNLAVTDYINGKDGECHRTSTGVCASKAEDDTKNRGWEFEVAGEITPNWQLQASFSSSSLRKSNKELISNTKTANLFTTYKATSSLTIGGGLSWHDKFSSDSIKNSYINIGREDLVGEAEQDDYYVVDLMANYEFNKNLSLLVNINNALNKEYKTNFEKYAYGEERNWMATLKYKF
nr:TonB-dependent siderophore receptor [Aliarcobacter vitoriensis]